MPGALLARGAQYRTMPVAISRFFSASEHDGCYLIVQSRAKFARVASLLPRKLQARAAR